ncbi:MAG: 2-isopropylmalate synthase [Planctomycetaceae bacterium]
MVSIVLFDTTLRDGEQSPGCAFNREAKMLIATALCDARVDVIEAGFPASSPFEADSVSLISKELGSRATICALSRCSTHDIQQAAKCVRPAAKSRIHLFLATSDLHLRYKHRLTHSEAIDRIRDSVRVALMECEEVEFSAEDATRSDEPFLKEAVLMAVDAGARIINIPDTVGKCLPQEYGLLISRVVGWTDEFSGVIISAHTHNDCGLATANAIFGIQAGARQVEVTINGIGERAGNASLEEVAMTIQSHPAAFDVETQMDLTKLVDLSHLVSEKSRMGVAPNKAIVGRNAFRHESGIHQHGILSNPETYQFIHPSTVGAGKVELAIGKHSGRHSLVEKMLTLGIDPEKLSIVRLKERIVDLCESGETIDDATFIQIAQQLMAEAG